MLTERPTKQCKECVIKAQVYALDIGAPVGVSVKGEPQYLLIPQNEGASK